MKYFDTAWFLLLSVVGEEVLCEFFPELLSSHEFVGHSSEELVSRGYLHSASTDTFYLDIVIFLETGMG